MPRTSQTRHSGFSDTLPITTGWETKSAHSSSPTCGTWVAAPHCMWVRRGPLSI